MNIKFAVNYSGYVPVLRGILLLLKAGVISLSQLGPYILFIMQADFDPRHKYYRVVIRDDRQLAKASGVASTTIYRHRKELIEAGLLIEENGVTKVTNFQLFELDWIKKNIKSTSGSLEELFVTPQQDFVENENEIANLQYEQNHYDP